MRCHQTASGQSTGAEKQVDDEEDFPVQKLKNGTRRRGRTTDKANGSETSEEKDEDGNESQFGNQLGEVADSERVFPASTSQVASLNRELKALETRYFRTRLSLEKATEKNDQLRREMRKVAGLNTKQEREIFKLRHLIDRIQSERKLLEQQAISNRDYAKKIEHRFFMGTKGQSLAQCNLELSYRLRSLEKTLKKKDEVLVQSQRDHEEARDKLAIVQRALETRLESYELNGSLHTGLLFEISKLQDHSEALALHLARERKQFTELVTQVKVSQKRQEELEDAQTEREMWIATLEKERTLLDEQLALASGQVQTAACEKATLLRFIHEQAEAKFQLEARLKDEQTQRRQEVERAQHALQLWEEQKLELKTSLQGTQQNVERQRNEWEKLREALREQQEVNSTLRVREMEMKMELERLENASKKSEDEFLAAKDVCHELQITIEQYEEGGRLLRSEIATLETTRRELLNQMETKQSEERALREAMESALQDLSALSKQRNDAAKAMSEAVTISASSLEEQQALEQQVQVQRSQIEKLQNAKNLLQNAMLEQLTALRKQLQIERRLRIETETRLKHLKPVSTVEGIDTLNSSDVADWEAPQPLPPPSAPSVAPLPPYLVRNLQYEGLPSSSASSSTSSSSDEETSNEFLPVNFILHKPITETQTESETHISLLELAEIGE